MTYGTTYYISAVAGDNDGSGNVDLTDPCLSVSAGTPVTWYALPTVTANASATTVCSGSPVTLTGSGATSYSWDNGVTDGVSFTPTSTTTYTVTGTDANGCTGTDNVLVTVNPSPTFTITSTNPTTCGGNGTIVYNGLLANTTYNVGYDDNGTTQSPVSLTTNGSGQISLSLPAGTYSNFVVELNGCSSTDNSTVSLNDPVAFTISTSVIDESCSGTNGEITITANGASNPINYSIDNGSNYVTNNVFTGLPAGTYNIAVQDGSNCQAFTQATINNIPGPAITNVSSTDASCAAANDGSISITATGSGLMYDLNGGTPQSSNTFSGLAPGTYTVNVDNGTCSVSQSVTVGVAAPLSFTVTTVDETCAGSADGEISVTATGSSLMYDLDGGTPQASNVFNGLSAGTYNVNVTYGSGCISTQSVTINAASPMTVTKSVTDAACGQNNGEITLTVNGGTPPYTYSWSHDTALNSQTATGLTGGNYVFTVTSGACSVTDSAVVNGGNNNMIVYAHALDVSCKGEADGYAVVDSIVGGNPPYNYMWDNGIDNISIANLTENIYQVTVTDQSGCKATKNTVVGYTTEDCLDIFTAISPNSDGENDTWTIKGIHSYDNANVKIFNRWGSLIYESDDYQNDWDGEYKAKPLPAGVYFYIITLEKNGEVESFEGSLTIIR
jgi:gliding motility-associated-like protein